MSNDQTHLSETSFASLGLNAELLNGLNQAGFEFCTPIQESTLPLALQGKDVAGQAQTGTGKTAAFLLATFERLMANPAPAERKQSQIRALILAPTRELAIQIHKDAVQLGGSTGLTLGLAYGGTDYDKQRAQIEAGVDILIGTPGRIIDYFKQRVFDMRLLQVAVLDEADRMFDLGFIKDVRFLFRRMPDANKRLNLLFSATLSFKVTELAYEHMNMPELVKIEPEQVTAEKVDQKLYYPAEDEKIPLLIGLLQSEQPERSIIFVNTKRAAEKIDSWLRGNDFQSAVLTGDVPQRKREKLLQRFQSGELPLLVTTDVAARGIHVAGVTHVFNYDLPQDAEDYVHRIGRTARAGASGTALSFACETYAFSMPEIEKYVGMKIPYASISSEMLPELKPAAKRERYGDQGRDGKGGRGGKGRGRNDRNRGGQRRSGQSSKPSENATSEAKAEQAAPAGDGNGPTPKPEATDGNPPPKKRRRRRRRPSSKKPAGEQGSTPADKPAASD